MSLLLDTHVLLWWLNGDPIRTEAAERIADPDEVVVVSAASVWEAGIKAALGKLDLRDDLVDAIDRAGFDLLGISATHAWAAAVLPPHHRDPFDRMLIAQAGAERLTLGTRDAKFDAYDVDLVVC